MIISLYKSIKNIKLIFVLFLLGVSNIRAQTIDIIPGDFIELGITDISLSNIGTACSASDSCYTDYIPDIMRIYTGSPSTPVDCTNAAILEDIDGYRGIRLPWGGILVIYSGSITGNSFSRLDSSEVSPVGITWSEKGNVTLTGVAKAYLSSACWYSHDHSIATNDDSSAKTTVAGNISVGLYVPADVPKGTYTIPEYKVNRYSSSSIPLIGTNSIVNVKSSALKCSILTTPVINFGLVKITGVPSGGLLASKVQNVNITCTSDKPDAISDKMTVSFEGDYSGTFWGRLDVKNSSGDIMGYIRGRYLEDSGSCSADSVNEVGFNGVSGTKTISSVGVGSRSVPVTWSLCNNASGRLGEGTAKATVKIQWN